MHTPALSIGSSSFARYVEGIREDSYRELERTAAYGKQSAYDELAEVYEESRVADWDASGARPVEQDTVRNAYLFLESLPLGFPLPSVGADPNGHVSFEWYLEPRRLLSVAVSPDNELHYASLIGSSKLYGTEVFFGTAPRRILQLVQDVL